MKLPAPSWRIIAAASVLLASFPLLAAPTRFGDDLARQLRRSGGEGTVASGRIVLPTGEEATLHLEEFEVYAPGAVIEAIGEGGEAVRLPRPDVRYFRGALEGDPTSLAFLAVGKSAQGFIVRQDRKYRLRSMARTKPRLVRNFDDVDIVIEEVELTEEMPWEGDPWSCDVDHYSLDPIRGNEGIVGAMEHVEADSLASPTATYVLNIAVEGDHELYLRQSSNSTSTATYLSTLIAATSVIYKRDLQTELRIAYSGHFTTSSDPFTMDPATNSSHSTLDALVEVGKRWHNTPPSAAPRSMAALVSGKDIGSGIAWLDTICEGDFSFSTANVSNGWGGAYAVFMDAGLATNFNPDLHPNYQADNDRFGFEYWPVLAFAHELGHNVQSSHTHCIALTSQEKSDFGVTRNFVDECFSDEGTGCYDDPDVGDSNDPSRFQHAVNANLPPELGTVMSYCHLTTGDPIGFGAATRYTFGQAGEPSIKVVNAMKSAINAKTPTLSSAITAPSSVTSGVAAEASITLGSSLSYLWTITNGSINSGSSGTTGGGGTFVVNFTPTADPVRLAIRVTNASGCSASDYKDITVSTVALNAPTNVVATATTSMNVNITWTAASGASSYQVHRSIDGAAYAQVGTTSGTSFNDGLATAGTAYLYKVRSVDGSANTSAFSNIDLATTVIFTDPTLTVGATLVKAVHFTELRTAVNAVRALAGLSATSFTDGALSPAVTVKALHLSELRTSLNSARTALALGAVSYTDASPTGVLIKALHLQELRDGVR